MRILFSILKTEERNEARRLRSEEGRSVREIEQLLQVARSSVSRWVREIELTPDQHAALRERNPAYNRQLAGRSAWAAHCRQLREAWQEEGRQLARDGDPTYAAGCMLYWAEGDKNKNCVGLSNADVEVVRFFVAFLRKYFDVPDEKFTVRCNLFADHVERQREVERFWLNALQLPGECLRKSMVNVYSKHSQRKRRNMLPYGTCKLTVCSTRVVQSIFGSIQEYGQFNRPAWLG